MKSFSLSKRNNYPFFFFIAIAVLLGVIIFFIPSSKQHELFLPAVAAGAGFAYFLYNQHIQETRLFNDLFRQFNEKYDSLNEELNKIANNQEISILSLKDKQTLFDYFNLCSEEYLYFKTGFIDTEVWTSWCKGMCYFASVEHIRVLWESELAGGSYYGFKLSLILFKH